MRISLKRMLCSKEFFWSLLTLFITLQGYPLPMYYAEWLGPDSIELAYRQSALHMTLGGIFFGGVILIIPFVAAIAAGVAQVDDLRSGYIGWMVLRSSRKQYMLRQMSSAFICGAAACGGAYFANSLLWHIIVLPHTPDLYPGHDIGFAGLFNEWQRIAYASPIIMQIGLGIMFAGGIWAIVAITTAMWIPDKILVLVVPAVIYKLWSISLPYHLFRIWIATPDVIFNQFQSFAEMLECLAYYGVLLLICIMLYRAGLIRRTKHV